MIFDCKADRLYNFNNEGLLVKTIYKKNPSLKYNFPTEMHEYFFGRRNPKLIRLASYSEMLTLNDYFIVKSSNYFYAFDKNYEYSRLITPKTVVKNKGIKYEQADNMDYNNYRIISDSQLNTVYVPIIKSGRQKGNYQNDSIHTFGFAKYRFTEASNNKPKIKFESLFTIKDTTKNYLVYHIFPFVIWNYDYDPVNKFFFISHYSKSEINVYDVDGKRLMTFGKKGNHIPKEEKFKMASREFEKIYRNMHTDEKPYREYMINQPLQFLVGSQYGTINYDKEKQLIYRTYNVGIEDTTQNINKLEERVFYIRELSKNKPTYLQVYDKTKDYKLIGEFHVNYDFNIISAENGFLYVASEFDNYEVKIYKYQLIE